MEEQNNHIGNFFRKRFTEPDEMGGAWSRPDAAVRQTVLAQISTPAPFFLGVSKLFFSVVLGTAVVLTAAYIFYLTQKIHSLEAQATALAEQIALSPSESEVQYLSEEKEKWACRQEAHQLDIAQLAERIQSLQDSLGSLKKSPLIQYVRSEKEVPTPPVQLEPESSAFQAFQLSAIPQIPMAFQLSQVERQPIAWKRAFTGLAVRKRERFEIGFESTSLWLKRPIIRSFENLRTASDELPRDEIFSRAKGISLAFSPKPKWWIRSGIRTADVSQDESSRMVVAYNTAREYRLPTGEIGNDLRLASSTPYRATESQISLLFKRGETLQDGDWLEVNIREALNQQYLQIPLGVEYIHGDGRLGWSLQGGGQWNRITFGDYFISASIMGARGLPVTIARTFVASGRIPPSHFLSAYGGAGLNYQFFRHWQARVALAYNYNFIGNTGRFVAANKIDRSLKIGLYYQF